MTENVLSTTATIEDLICVAHRNAIDKGFWESVNIAEKLALIATEVNEFLEEFEAKRDTIEEVADIVIRTFDLCGFLKVTLPEDVLSYYEGGFVATHRFAFKQFQNIAAATQAHRKGKEEGVKLRLAMIVRLCTRYSATNVGGSLLEAVVKKMEKNRARPHKHGALY